MSRHLTLLLVSALCFQLPAPGPAEEIGASVERTVTGDLTLDRAVQLALRQNPQILLALQEIKRTHGQVVEVRAQALPQLSLNVNYDQQDPELIELGGVGGGGGGGLNLGGIQGIPPAVAAALGNLGNQRNTGAQPGGFDQSWNVTLQVRQLVYAGGQVKAALQIAKLTEDNSYWQLRDTVDTVIARTRTQFYSVLLAKALIFVAEESVQLQEDQLKDQQNRFEAGTVPRFNVLRAEVELANVRPNLIRARNNLLITQLDLSRTLGIEAAPDGHITFQIVGELNIAQRPLDLTNALAMARERRPFLKVQRQRILIQAEQIKVALAGYKPRLNVNGGVLVRDSQLTDDLSQAISGWFIGVTGSWNIFDGLETAGRTQQTRAQLESARVTYEDSVRQVEIEVQQSYANLQQARETIQSQQKNVEQALEALRLARERLAAGAGTQLDVLDARVALTRARSTEVEARADYARALAEFDRATATNTKYDDGFDDPLAHRKPGKKATARATPAPALAKKKR